MDEVKNLKLLCNRVRKDIISMIAEASSGHPGGSLSAVELMVGIYHVMRVDPKNPDDPMRDRFVLSKGHAAPCYYAILGEKGFFDVKEFGISDRYIVCFRGIPMQGRFLVWTHLQVHWDRGYPLQ